MGHRRIVFLLVLLLPAVLSIRPQALHSYFYLEAEKCRLAGDISSAAELYQHCLDINPDASEAVYGLSLVQFYLHNDSLGLQMLQRATELDPRNPWYLETLANYYLNKRETDAVIPVLERLAALQKRRSDVLSQLAMLYHTVGDTDKAIEALERIERLEGKSIALSVEKFSLHMERKEKAEAFAELQALCDEFPHDMNCKVVVGNQYQQVGEMQKAWEVYEEVRQREPSNARLQLALLSYWQATHDEARFCQLRDSLLYDSASPSQLRVTLMRDYIDRSQRDTTLRPLLTQAFDSVLSMPQKDAELLTLKAAYQTYTKADKQDVAETMRRILDVEPGNELAMSHLLQYYASENNLTAMEDICRRGVNYHPEELAYSFYLAVALGQQEQTAEAREALLQGLRARNEDSSPQLLSDMYALLGDLYARQELTEQAFEAYDSALVYVEDNISCLNNYAYYLSLRGERLDEAEEMSYRTLKADPRNVTYLDTYAWILFIKKDYAGARIYMERVVSPEATGQDVLQDERLQGNIIEHAGDVYAMCGLTDEALRLWRLAVQKGDDTCTKSIRKKIKQKKYVK